MKKGRLGMMRYAFGGESGGAHAPYLPNVTLSESVLATTRLRPCILAA